MIVFSCFSASSAFHSIHSLFFTSLLEFLNFWFSKIAVIVYSIYRMPYIEEFTWLFLYSSSFVSSSIFNINFSQIDFDNNLCKLCVCCLHRWREWDNIQLIFCNSCTMHITNMHIYSMWNGICALGTGFCVVWWVSVMQRHTKTLLELDCSLLLRWNI